METDKQRHDRMGASSNAMTDRESAAVQQTPYRIALKMIRDAIKSCSYYNPPEAPQMTICIAMLSNGFMLTGKSVPADPENFDEQLGRKFAYEDAERSAWPLFAFALREMISDRPCLAPLSDVKFWAAPEPRPFNPAAEVDEIARMEARKHAALNPDDE